MPILLKLLFAHLIAYSTVLPIMALNTTKAEWPRFLVASVNEFNRIKLQKFDPNTGISETAESEGFFSGLLYYLGVGPGLTANAYSDKICRTFTLSAGIICHQNYSFSFPDIPQGNYHSNETPTFNSMSLSPFGDHLIFEEFRGGGVWLFSFETQQARLLMPYVRNDTQFTSLQVDWDNGYLLALPINESRDIQVWEFQGHNGLSFNGNFGFIKDQTNKIISFTIDTATMTAYWATETFLAKKSYNVEETSEPQVITSQSFAHLAPGTFRFFDDGIFWYDFKSEGVQQPIYRFDLESFDLESRNVTLSSEGSKVYSLIVFEDSERAKKNSSNPCSKCSHICIPRRGYGYECTCPFEQPLSSKSIPVDGVRTECQKPLIVWVIAVIQKTEEFWFWTKTLEPETYLMSLDAMAKTANSSILTSEYLSIHVIANISQGYCTSVGTTLECFRFTGSSMGFWHLDGRKVVSVFGVTAEEAALVWFNGSCILHQSKTNVVWTLYCNSEIDQNQIVVDFINWYVFYRNRKTGDLVSVDLVGEPSKYEARLVSSTMFNVTKKQPRGLAVDEVNQVLYWLSASKLYQLHYSLGLRGRSGLKAEIIFELNPLDSIFEGQQLRFIEGLLYWVQIRPKEADSSEHVIVRFNVSSQTQETFVKVPGVTSISSFGVDVPRTIPTRAKCSNGCSHFCGRRNKSHRCWCPNELAVLLGNVKCVDGNSTFEEPLKFSVTWVILGMIGAVPVVAFLKAIGFRIYKRYMRIRTNIVYNSFLNGNESQAHDAQTGARRAQVVPFNSLLDPQLLKVFHEKLLGEGNFGLVYEGEYDGRRVAVKTLKDKAGINTLEAFFKELKIMAYVGSHQNVVELIGAEVSGLHRNQVFAVLEFCPNGSLEGYLRNHRDAFSSGTSVDTGAASTSSSRSGYQNIVRNNNLNIADSVNNQTYTSDTAEICETSFITTTNTADQSQLQVTEPKPSVTVQNLSNWSHQIGRAMSFLSSKSIVHGDLATRNVLVFDDNTLKVTDFGQSHDLYRSSIYIDRDQTRQVPWKWMSPEALGDRLFSSKSDVWSYGVTMWEVFMFAMEPYPDRGWHPDFLKELKDGSLRLPKPEIMPQEVYDAVFIRCFETSTNARIDFASIEDFWNRYLITSK